jgi:hypothetical protein
VLKSSRVTTFRYHIERSRTDDRFWLPGNLVAGKDGPESVYNAASLSPREASVAKLSSTDILVAFDACALALAANWAVDAASTLEIVSHMV